MNHPNFSMSMYGNKADLFEAKARYYQDKFEKLIDILIDEGVLKGREVMPPLLSVSGSHGSCCNCADCGHDNDSCVCRHNELLGRIDAI